MDYTCTPEVIASFRICETVNKNRRPFEVCITALDCWKYCGFAAVFASFRWSDRFFWSTNERTKHYAIWHSSVEIFVICRKNTVISTKRHCRLNRCRFGCLSSLSSLSSVSSAAAASTCNVAEFQQAGIWIWHTDTTTSAAYDGAWWRLRQLSCQWW